MNVDLANDAKRPHPLVGTVVEPYAILDVIAAGGMGVVFKARHMLTDRIVAMKLLPAELARDESNVQRVKLEAKALAQLNHPNIVTTFDFGFTYMQEPFIVMEYVAGESLKEVLDREVLLPVDRALKIFLQAVDAMRYAHAAKILHRDLKPHNIMVSEEPEPDHVKILDFGVAKLAEYTQKITRTGEVVGSPLYMSPEQCTGKPTDHRCDIYSIGVMMFETLTGNPPFRGENYISTVHLKCTKLAPNFRDVVPGRVFPDRLEMIVLKCLEIDPEKRYANMSELKGDLELVAGVVPRVERPKTSQNLTFSTRNAPDEGIATTGTGPGEVGWQPSWSGAAPGNTPGSRTASNDFSDSIVSGIADDESWRTPSSPNLSDDDWTGRKENALHKEWEQPALETEDSDWSNQKTPNTVAPKQNSGLLLTQDLASLSAALEASSVTGPFSQSQNAPTKPLELKPASDEITGDHPIAGQPNLGAGPVPVPNPNKEQNDSHFVLTWDSKTGPSWSATSAAPQKPKAPGMPPTSTGTRNPVIQQPEDRPRPEEPTAPPVQHELPQQQPPQHAGAPQEPPNQAWNQSHPNGQTQSSSNNPVVNSAAAYGWAPPPAQAPQAVAQSGQQMPAAVQHFPPGMPKPGGLPSTVAPPMTAMPPQQQITPSQGPHGGPQPQAPMAQAPHPGYPGGLSSPQQQPAPQPQVLQPQVLQPPVPPQPHQQAPQPQPVQPSAPIPQQPTPTQPPFMPQAGPPQPGQHPDPWAESIPPGAPHPPGAPQPSGAPAGIKGTGGWQARPNPMAPPNAPPLEKPPWGTEPTTMPDTARPTPELRSQDVPPPSASSIDGWNGSDASEPLEPEERTVVVAKPQPPQPAQEAPPPGKPNFDLAKPVIPQQVEPPPPVESPIKQLAKRVTEGQAEAPQQASLGNSPDFKSYEPVSLAELNAIKTPSVKASKPTGESGLSTVLPSNPTSSNITTYNKPRTKYEDSEEGVKHGASAMRFSSSRGGNDGKKAILISLVGVAIVVILGTACFMVYQHSASQKDPLQQRPASHSEQTGPASAQDPTSATTSSTTSESSQTSSDTTSSTTSSAESAATTPAPPSPSQSSIEKAKKKAALAKAAALKAQQRKKAKKPKTVTAKTSSPAAESEPAKPRKRRAYSTYDSYYGSE